MSTAIRVVLVFSLAAGLFWLWLGRGTPAQTMPDARLFLGDLEEKARAAKANDPHAIREFTDHIFDQSMLARAAESLRDRVSRCEAAFRQGTQKAIGETELVNAVNTQIRALNGPPFLETNVSQIRTIRGYRRRFVPDFVEPAGPKEKGLAVSMSPAEAAYLVLTLGTHKMMNPDYRVTPQEWDRRVAVRRAAEPHGRGAPHARLSGTMVPPEVGTLQLTAERDIAVESSDVVQQAHRFLDALGFQR